MELKKGTKGYDDEVEQILYDYFKRIKAIEAYNAQLSYYNKNKDNFNDEYRKCYEQEIDQIKRNMIALEFKNKSVDVLFTELDPESKMFLKLKYKENLGITIINRKLYMRTRTYYRKRRTVLDYFSKLIKQ